jgi:sugar lactone lactonase YvrE
MISHRIRVLLVIAVLVSSVVGITSTARAVTANEAFDAVWSATDLAVQNQTATYSWFWGPTPRAQRFEPYLNSPGGQREVRYYDKSRMEINDPGGDPNNIYYVTNGLLTVELVTGQLKRGDGPNDVEQHAPATQLVAGDPLNNPGTPSYAAFGPYVTVDAKTNRSTDKTGQAANAFMSGTGQVSTTDSRGVTLAHYQSITGHNIASVFWDWFNSPSSGFRTDIGIDWVYTAGLPISEPYWIDATVGGSTKKVLVQLFERRVMTYTDTNNDPYRIEWGNIGQHYQGWQDAATGPAPCPDSPAGTYLYVADTLNDRIQKFDASGNYVCSWLGDYDLDGPSARPWSLAVDNQNNLYVNAGGRIEKYDQRGRFLDNWGTDINAWDIAIDSQGNFYMTDVAAASVKKYSPSGNFIAEWDSVSSDTDTFDSLTGITIDAQDNVYIADRNNNRIVKFTASGTYLGQWDANDYLPDPDWQFPDSVTVDNQGNFYATAGFIYKFVNDGESLVTFGEVGDLIALTDLDFGANGTIYAIDALNTTIKQFSTAGALLDEWGGSGSGPGQFNGLRGIAASTR